MVQFLCDAIEEHGLAGDLRLKVWSCNITSAINKT